MANVGNAALTNVLLSTGNGSTPSFGTAPIAAGGTNATSMSTNTGIVKFDGTRLVTSTTALIDASNRYTNISQPAVQAQVNAVSVANVTGDGTVYTVIFDAEQFDHGNNFNTTTGEFTAPVTGIYFAAVAVSMLTLTAAFTQAILNLTVVGKTSQFTHVNPGVIMDNQNVASMTSSTFVAMTAGDVFKVTIQVGGGTKTVGIYGNNTGAHTWLSMYLFA